MEDSGKDVFGTYPSMLEVGMYIQRHPPNQRRVAM